MIQFNLKIIIVVIVLANIIACNHKQPLNTDNMQTEIINDVIFPKGNKLSGDYFTGNAFLYPLVTKDKNNEFSVGCVTFEPGARTNWHRHPKGQVLIVTAGEGYYQQRGKPAQALKKGDTVNIPEDIEHWHGASVQSSFVHIAITNYKNEENVIWLNPVTDDEYGEVNK